jgi:hypothetical protein
VARRLDERQQPLDSGVLGFGFGFGVWLLIEGVNGL